MNPRPVIPDLGACYPDNYGPHQSSTTGKSASPRSPAAEKVSSSQSGAEQRPLILKILPLRFIPGLKSFYTWLIDDYSQPAPTPAELISKHVKTGSEKDSGSIQGRALELGCATGNYLRRLQDAGWTVTGIEPAKRPAADAKNLGFDVTCGTLETSELPPDSFDLAVAWMVIEHVPYPRETLRQLRDLLKPGGTLLCSIPNAGCWEPKVFGKYWMLWELPRHLHHYTTKSIRELLEQSGFTDVKITHQRNISNVVGSLAIAIRSRWPKSRFGQWLMSYPDRPTVMFKLFLAPFAHFFALLGQGGRLTISSRRCGDEGAATERGI